MADHSTAVHMQIWKMLVMSVFQNTCHWENSKNIKKTKCQTTKQNCAPVSHLLSELFEVGFLVFPSMQPKTIQPVALGVIWCQTLYRSFKVLWSQKWNKKHIETYFHPPIDSNRCKTLLVIRDFLAIKRMIPTSQKISETCCVESNAGTPPAYFNCPNPGIHTFPSRFLPIGDSYFVTLGKKGLGHGWSKVPKDDWIYSFAFWQS